MIRFSVRRRSNKSHYQQFEPPFEIPESWEWVTVGDLLENRDAERVPVSSAIRKKQTNKIYDYYGAAGVIDKVDGFLFNERLLLVGEDGANLLSRNKDNAFFAEGKYWVNNHAHILDCHIKRVLDYVAIVINSYNLEPYITGSAQPKLSQDNLIKIPIPLPPLAEQHRILNTIEVTTKYVDAIISNKSVLEDRISFIKSKILELAMQGKLVAQDPADEPAADMLRRINPKAKIITDNPHSWNIPIGWILGSLKEIVNCPSSKQFQIQQSEIKQNGCIPVISQSSNFIEGYSENEDKIFHPNNGIVIFGDHTKNVKFFSEGFIIGADGVKLIDWNFDKKFLFYLIKYIAEEIPNKGYSRHFQYLLAYVVGLPPLNEQKRIVSKIEELYACLDEMEASLQS